MSQQSDFIHIDQFGYTENAVKVAVISNPQVGFNSSSSFTPSATIEVRNANTDAIVYSGAPIPWSDGSIHSQSGDSGWWFDFTSISTPGDYYIYDALENERSANFSINNTVYNTLIEASSKMFYYNRCGFVKNQPFVLEGFTDGMSFAQDEFTRDVTNQNNTETTKDMRGGWFDAGDYNKYVTFADTAVHDLLWAYQLYPEVFTDAFNIAESGNGIPDILDEVKWELDWLLKMINSDGSVHIKMGSRNFSENISTPPSANNDTRYYAPVCTSSALAATTMLAHAAKVFREFSSMDSYAQLLEEKAELTWNWVVPYLNENTLQPNCDDGAVVAGDADRSVQEQLEMAINAAIYLFDLTNDASYNLYVIDNIETSEVITSGQWDNYNINNIDALLHYTTLEGADNITKTLILDDALEDVSNNYNNYFQFNDLSLYRDYSNDWTYHWGSSSSKARMGLVNQVIQHYGVNTNESSTYNLRAKETLHYFHGVNPLGIVYLSNMYDYGAEKSVNQIYHSWFYDGTIWDDALTSTYGPAPGFVTGGPNSNYTANTNLSPPYNQPLQKSYLDFNTGNPDQSWEITEPAIYYQAAYVRLLAGVISTSTSETLDLENFNSTSNNFKMVPNPSDSHFTITSSKNSQINITIHNLNGQVIMTRPKSYTNRTIDISSLNVGFYIVSVEKDAIKESFKLIKH